MNKIQDFCTGFTYWSLPGSGHIHIASGAAFVILAMLITLIAPKQIPTSTTRAPPHWRAHHWPVIGSSLQFFARRRDMFLMGRSAFPSGCFSFFVGKKHVVAITGTEARQVFFDTRKFSLAQGFVELLTGKLPSAKNDDSEHGIQNLIKPLLHLTRSDEMSKRIPSISCFISEFLDGLHGRSPSQPSEWQVMNFFDKVPVLVYRIMQQCVGFQEIAEDENLLHRTLFWYRKFESTTSKARIIFPWLYTPRHMWRLLTASILYIDLSRLLNRRRKSTRVRNDAVQFLMNQGQANYDIVEFIFSVFVAGLTTTTFTGLWLLIFLARFPTWKKRCFEEVDQALARNRRTPEQTPNEILKSLTLQDWETCFPLLGLCLRETLRLQLPGTMLRRNATGRDIPLGSSGEVIPAGAFAAYPVADTHLDPQLYPEPFSFKPERYQSLDALNKEPHTYLGWGSGRHPCAGQRLATILIIMITAHILANIDFELSDEIGADERVRMPTWDRNKLRMELPEEPCYMRYRCRETEASL